MQLRCALWGAGALLCALGTALPVAAQYTGGPYTSAPLKTLKDAGPAGSPHDSDTLWLCQLSASCGPNDPMKRGSVGVIGNYFDQRSSTLSNKTLQAPKVTGVASGTCVHQLAIDAAGNLITVACGGGGGGMLVARTLYGGSTRTLYGGQTRELY